MKIKGSHNFNTHARLNSARLDSILKIVCDHFSVSPESVRSSIRTADFAQARRIYCWMAKLHSKAGMPEIAASINLGMSAVHRLTKAVEDRHRSDAVMREAIAKIVGGLNV